MCLTLNACTLFESGEDNLNGDGSGFESKRVNAYLYNDFDRTSMTVLFRDGFNLPYINMEDYFSGIFEGDFTTTADGNNKYTITGPCGSVTFDSEKDTATFDRYLDFITADYVYPEEVDEVATSSYKVAGAGEQTPYTFNFGAYNIDVHAEGGAVFMPISSANLLVETTYRGALYYDGDIYFTDTYAPASWIDMSEMMDNTSIDKTLTQHNYNELCFLMDNIYGRPSRCIIAGEIGTQGFDKALISHDDNTAYARDLLQSDNMLEYCYGLEILGLYLEDGGHSSPASGFNTVMDIYDDSKVTEKYEQLEKDFSNKKTITDITLNQAITRKNEVIKSNWHKTITKYQSVNSIVDKARDTAFNSYNQVKTWGKNSNAIKLITSGDTAIFSFDHFAPDVFKPLLWSLDYAKNQKLNNFVLDITHNEGGDLSSLVWMTSVLTNQGTLPGKLALNNDKLSIQAFADKKLDGKYNDKDNAVNYSNLRIAVLTSELSYSCANIMPAVFKNNGVPIIGQKSRGGGCDLIFHLGPYGIPVQVSGPNTFTDTKYNEIDAGVTPDAVIIDENVYSINDYMKLYDINTIRQAINKHYAR